MNEIFVFGSNLAGRHGKGAALFALNNRGAIRFQGVGRQGSSYAIPTKGLHLEVLPLQTIAREVKQFLIYAGENPTLQFEVTRIGCGLAGYKNEDIAPLFKGVPSNCVMPVEWAGLY